MLVTENQSNTHANKLKFEVMDREKDERFAELKMHFKSNNMQKCMLTKVWNQMAYSLLDVVRECYTFAQYRVYSEMA